MIAKLGQGLSRHQVARDLGCVPSTVVKAARRFAEAGEEGLLDQRAFKGVTKVDARFKETLEQVIVAFMRAYNQRKKLNPSLRTAPAVSGSRSIV